MALITGAAGFIGQNLMKKMDAVPFDLKYGDDVTNSQALKALYRKGPIIHLAAESGVPQSIEDPGRSFYSNVLGTFTVLNFARDKAKVIFASSAAADNLTSPYAASKAAGEAYCQAYHLCYGVESTCLRFSNVYGPLSDKKTSVVAQMIKSAIFNDEILLEGGRQQRDFVYVEDVCEGIIKATEMDGFNILRVGSGQYTEVGEVAKIISDLTGARIKNVKMRDNEILKPKDSHPLMKVNVTPLEEGIKKTMEYFA